MDASDHIEQAEKSLLDAGNTTSGAEQYYLDKATVHALVAIAKLLGERLGEAE